MNRNMSIYMMICGMGKQPLMELRKIILGNLTLSLTLLDSCLLSRGYQYNCQDWAEDVRRAYYCTVNKVPYYPQGTTFIGGRP